MTDYEIFNAVIATLNAGLQAVAVTGVVVQQAYQPKVTGRPKVPALLLSCQPAHRFGYVKREDKWDDARTIFTHTETQWWERTFQCDGYTPPKDPPAPGVDAPPGPPWGFTANDLAMRGSSILQSDAGRHSLRVAGLGIERITDVRQPYFKNEQDQFESSPSFDFVLTYKQVDVTTTPRVEKIAVKIDRV